ncbi:BQ2448_2411 [Microbotryum intermedium]|uniref:mRNA export factor GLE1 n=1 Tax=Microbotryum intermedium TaxID=269621 RepID=A0A238FBC3_9BASI|nr:BQ2448_2411 [Microbotryum intermedium]
MKFGLEPSSSSSASEAEHDDARVDITSVRRSQPVVKHGDNDDDSDAPVPLERLASRPIRKAPFRRRPPAGLSNPIPSTSTLTFAPTASASSPSTFVPRSIRTVAPPSVKSRKGKLVQLDSNSSDEELDQPSWRRRDARHDHDDEDDGDDDPDDDDGYSDSEEYEWPVGPIGSVGIGGWRRANGDAASGRAKARSNRMHVQASLRVATSPDHFKAHGGTDAFQIWDDRSKAISWVGKAQFATANRSFHLSLARSFSTSPTATRTPSSSITNDMSSIESRLSSLALQASAEKAALVQSFQMRNAALWDSIEASIREAEKEEGDRQRLLEENRRKRQEAERKAKEMREAEERKKKEEEERKAKDLQERERKEAEERKRKEEEEVKRQKEQEERDKKLAVIAPPSGKGIEGSPQTEWERWAGVMTQIKTNVLPIVSQNPTYRKECFTAKRAITPKIGQLTASAEMTLRVINQLDRVLSSMRPPTGGPKEPYLWTLNHLAKALVKQAETEVTARISTAYPLGRVVIGLIVRGHQDLGEVLMARLVKKCFWITGWWPPKQPGQTEEAHQKSLGHAPPSTGESLIQYASRMSGVIALYAAITQTSPLEAPQGPCSRDHLSHVPPHFRLSAGWRWIVLILRVPLVGLQPTPQLLGSFFEIAGERLLEVYGRQFAKVLEVVLKEGIREGKAGFNDKSVSSTVRLTLWLEEWEKNGKVEQTQGRRPDP